MALKVPVATDPLSIVSNCLPPSYCNSTPALPFKFNFLAAAVADMSISPELFDIVVLPSVLSIFKSVPSCSIVASDPVPRIIYDACVKVMSSFADTAISVLPVTLPVARVSAKVSLLGFVPI